MELKIYNWFNISALKIASKIQTKLQYRNEIPENDDCKILTSVKMSKIQKKLGIMKSLLRGPISCENNEMRLTAGSFSIVREFIYFLSLFKRIYYEKLKENIITFSSIYVILKLLHSFALQK